MLALELSVLKDRLTECYRQLFSIGSNVQYRPRDRLNALTSACEVALSILKLHIQGPLIFKHLNRVQNLNL